MKKLVLLLLLLAGFISLTYAQPAAPASLAAESYSSGYTKYVKLTWERSTGAPNSRIEYTVYKKAGAISDSGKYTRLPYKISASYFIDKMVESGKTYSYYVTAKDKNGESAPSEAIQIELGVPVTPALVTGRITDEATGAGLKNANVYFIPVAASPVHGYMNYYVKADSQGNYSYRLIPGKYFVEFNARGYYPEFFDNTQGFKNAKQILVNSNDTLYLSASLAPVMPPVIYTLKGKVTDSLSVPLKASIQVFVLNRKFFTRKTLSGMTDSLGNYSVKVKQGDSVVVYVQPLKKDYLPEFYSNKKEFSEADKIVIGGNVTNIDFVLEHVPVYNNAVAGTVSSIDTASLRVPASVTAIRLKDGIPGKRFRTTVFADSLGSFSLTNLVPGSYILLAVPVEGYLPAFFRYDGTPAMNWKKADTVVVTASSVIIGIEFNVLPVPYTLGLGVIAGAVKDNSGIPINGSLVYAYDGNSQIAAYTTSDADGSFLLAGINPGSYSITTDKVDYSGSTADAVQVSYLSAAQQNVSLTLSPVTVTEVKTESQKVLSYSLEQNYPNPFNPTTTIGFRVAETGMVSLKVYNIIGQQVAALVNEVKPAGVYNVRFNAAGLVSGVYFYTLEAGRASITRKMVVLK